MSANCPSCGGALKKVPQRKTKCPHCGAYMFIRATPNDPTRRLVSTAAAEAIDRAWSERNSQRRVDEAAALFGLPAGLTVPVLRAELAQRMMDESDRKHAMLAAAQLSTFEDSDARRDAAMRWYYAHQLCDLRDRGTSKVELIAGIGACPACAAIGGRELTVADALEQIVPSPDCEMVRTGRPSCAWWSASQRGNPYGIRRTIGG